MENYKILRAKSPLPKIPLNSKIFYSNQKHKFQVYFNKNFINYDYFPFLKRKKIKHKL